jgi:hypothetical protein
MKKFLMMGVLAVTAVMLSQQQASAWINTRFSIGFNWQWQSGNNSWFWGTFVNGQTPGFDFGPGFEPDVMPNGHHHGYYLSQNGIAEPSHHAYSYTQPTYQTVSYPGYYSMPTYYYPVSGYYGR